MVKITKEFHELIQKYISDDGSFESRYLNFEVNKFYEWHYVMDAIQIVNSYSKKINRVGYYNKNKNKKLQKDGKEKTTCIHIKGKLPLDARPK